MAPTLEMQNDCVCIDTGHTYLNKEFVTAFKASKQGAKLTNGPKLQAEKGFPACERHFNRGISYLEVCKLTCTRFIKDIGETLCISAVQLNCTLQSYFRVTSHWAPWIAYYTLKDVVLARFTISMAPPFLLVHLVLADKSNSQKCCQPKMPIPSENGPFTDWQVLAGAVRHNSGWFVPLDDATCREIGIYQNGTIDTRGSPQGVATWLVLPKVQCLCA